MESESVLIHVGLLILCFLIGVLAGLLLQRFHHAKTLRKGFEQNVVLAEKRVELLREAAKLLKTIDDFHYAMRVKGEIEDLTKDSRNPEG